MDSRQQLRKEPSLIEADVVRYLSSPEDNRDEGETVEEYRPARLSADLCVKEILENVIGAVEWRNLLKKTYDEKMRENNQVDLFDLKKVIPDFSMSDQIINDLVFRDTLTIGRFESDGCALPIPVGGLVIDVQLAKGDQPLKRYEPEKELELLEVFTKRLEDEIAIKAQKSTDFKTSERILVPPNEDVMNYMEFLRNEMKISNSKFLVHVSSQFDYEGQNAGSRITAWVDKNMHTLEERRTEFLKDDDGTICEKSLYSSLQKNKYYVVNRSKPGNIEEKRFYSLDKARHFVGEGASFVLMRYLALARFIGEFEMSTMYINGDMCRNIYICDGPESGVVNNKKLDLCKIYRIIIEECGITHKCCTVLTLQGQLIKQDWTNCMYILQLNPLAKVSNNKPENIEKIPLEKRWEDDMQLFSMYLDKTVACNKEARTYLLDYPEVKDMIADFFQNILLMKPDTVLEYALDYFSQFIPKVPHTDYFETSSYESFSI